MISTVSIVLMFVVGLVCFALPIGMAVWLRRKYHSPMLPMLIGCAVFTLFALVLEQVCHGLVLNFTSIGDSVLLSAVYGGLAAGLFEETGRLIGFRFFMKGNRNFDDALMCGAGHGGAEAVSLVGLTMLVYGYLSVSLNTNPALMTGESAETYQKMAASLGSIKALDLGLSGFERILAFTIQICLSVLVMTAVARPGKMWLYPAAAVIHAVIDGVASGLTAVLPAFGVELVILVMTAALVLYTVSVQKRWWKDVPRTEPEPRPAGSLRHL